MGCRSSLDDFQDLVVGAMVDDGLGGVDSDLPVQVGRLCVEEGAGCLLINFGECFVAVSSVVAGGADVGSCVCVGAFLWSCLFLIGGLVTGIAGLFVVLFVVVAVFHNVIFVLAIIDCIGVAVGISFVAGVGFGVVVAGEGFHAVDLSLEGVNGGTHPAYFPARTSTHFWIGARTAVTRVSGD